MTVSAKTRFDFLQLFESSSSWSSLLLLQLPRNKTTETETFLKSARMPSRERHHRRSTQIPTSEINKVHHLLSHAFSGEIPARQNHNSSVDSGNEEAIYSSSSSASSTSSTDSQTPPNKRPHTRKYFFPSNIGTPRRSYSRAMHAYHATSQPTPPSIPSSSPRTSIEKAQETQTKPKDPFAKPVPNYAKTMHAFTLNQLNYLNNTGSHPAAARPNINYNIEPESSTTTTKKPTTTTPTNPQQNPSTNPTTTTTTASPLLPLTSPLALKLPPSQSRTQYLSRSLSVLNQMGLDEEPCGPSNTPEPGERHLPPPPPTSISHEDHVEDGGVDVDADVNADSSEEPAATTPMFSMSPTEMLAQGRELEARFEELIRMGDADAVVVRGQVGSEGGGGLEFGFSEARDFARFRMVL